MATSEQRLERSEELFLQHPRERVHAQGVTVKALLWEHAWEGNQCGQSGGSEGQRKGRGGEAVKERAACINRKDTGNH